MKRAPQPVCAPASTAAALVLAHIFPSALTRLERIAEAAGVSRNDAGPHCRLGVDGGTAIEGHAKSLERFMTVTTVRAGNR